MRKPSQLDSRKKVLTESTKKRVQVYPRATVGGQVLIHNDEHLFIAPLSNLSAGGVFIDQLIAIPPGSEVRIVVRSPRMHSPVQAKGSVVRVEKQSRKGLAVEFTSISGKAREAIQNCIAESRIEKALKVS